MDWQSVATRYGLRHPYDFSVALPLMLNLLCLCAVLTAGVYLILIGQLSPGTLRFKFLLYVAILLGIGAAASRASIASYAILVWCSFELCVGFFSYAIARKQGSPSLLPLNYAAFPRWHGHVHHPLLQAVPKRGWTNASGTIHHNMLGFRGPELTQHDIQKPLIFVYGGSTTYDVGVTDGHTWVEVLQSHLRGDFTVMNFGVSGASSTEHLVQTAIYQNDFGKLPVCALYYVGWNEITNAHIPNIDRGYADWQLLRQLDSARRPLPALSTYSPMLRLGYELLRKRVDSLPPVPVQHGPPITEPNSRLEEIFREHLHTISAINSHRGVKTLLIGQVMNKARLSSSDLATFSPRIRKRDVWPLIARLNAISKEVATANGDKYLDVAIDSFIDSDFVDEGHFSTAGSLKFANFIWKDVSIKCRP